MRQPLIYDVLHTEGDFYLGNETAKGQVSEKEGGNLEALTKNDKLSDGSSRRKTGKENGLSRPKSKRAKKGKIRPSIYFRFHLGTLG